MPEISLNDIKYENAKNVFRILRAGKNFSRAEISNVCGLSLMTVGKIIELLDSVGLIIQHKSDGKNVGRKSYICSVNTERRMMIFDFSNAQKLYSVDMMNNIRADYSLEYDNFESVFAECFFESSSNGELIGIGLILPNKSPNEALERFGKLSKVKPSVTLTNANACAVGVSENDGLSIFLFSNNGKNINGGAMVYNGKLISNCPEFDNKTVGETYETINTVKKLFAPQSIKLCLKNNITDISPQNCEVIREGILPIIGISKLITDKYIENICW